MMADPVDYSSRESSMTTFVVVWVVLVAINLLELLLAWKQVAPRHLFSVLLTLAMVNAILVVSFFMHLKYETRKLVLTLIPATLFVLFMMIEMAPDSTRTNTLRSPIKLDAPAEQSQPQQ